jgi:hypothetical protein
MHWYVEPDSVDVKANEALVLDTVPLGPELIAVSGGAVSVTMVSLCPGRWCAARACRRRVELRRTDRRRTDRGTRTSTRPRSIPLRTFFTSSRRVTRRAR